MQDFSVEGVRQMLGGGNFPGRNVILLFGIARKFWVIFQNITLKLTKIFKIIEKLLETQISQKYSNPMGMACIFFQKDNNSLLSVPACSSPHNSQNWVAIFWGETLQRLFENNVYKNAGYNVLSTQFGKKLLEKYQVWSCKGISFQIYFIISFADLAKNIRIVEIYFRPEGRGLGTRPYLICDSP